jgi:hypothetical protein
MEGFMAVFKSNCCSSRDQDYGGGLEKNEKVDIAAYFNQVHTGSKAYNTFHQSFHASQPQEPSPISMRLLILRCKFVAFVSCLPTMSKYATTVI